MIREAESVLLDRETVAKRVKEMAREIEKDYAPREEVIMICILRGASVFYTDLVRELDLDVRFEFMSVSSYGTGTTSSGEVRIIKDINVPLQGKHVIIVEDIIDSGNTLFYLKNILNQRNPASLKVCALLDKPSRRKVDFHGDYIGFTIEDKFVVGYGLDYADRFRNLKDICILKPEVYSK